MVQGPIGGDSGSIVTAAYKVSPSGETLTTNFLAIVPDPRAYARGLKNVSAVAIVVTAVMVNDPVVTGAGAPGSAGIAYTIQPNSTEWGAFTQVNAGSWTLGQIVAVA